jgi:hypothetical protein
LRALRVGLAITSIVGPALDVARETGETVAFSIADAPMRLCTSAADALSDLRHVVRVGARYPLRAAQDAADHFQEVRNGKLSTFGKDLSEQPVSGLVKA